MVKKSGRFYLSFKCSCTLHLLVKIKKVKLKNLHTLTCLNLIYGTTKQKTKMIKLQRWWDLSKPITSLIFFSFIILPTFCWTN